MKKIKLYLIITIVLISLILMYHSIRKINRVRSITTEFNEASEKFKQCYVLRGEAIKASNYKLSNQLVDSCIYYNSVCDSLRNKMAKTAGK